MEIRTEGDLDDQLRAQLVEIDRTWKGRGNEHGFLMSLDGLLTGREPDAVLPICRDAAGRPLAFQRYVRCRSGRALSLDAMRRYRDALTTLARRLEDLGAVEPSDLNRAADVFWYLFGWMSWRILITDLQWSWDEAEQWLAQRGIDALLRQQRRRP